MAKAPVIEENQLRHMLKVAGVTGDSPVRDIALLHVLYGTGMMLTELSQLSVGDYLVESGAVREESTLRAAIAHNNVERPLFWVNQKVVATVDAYLEIRVRLRHAVTTRKAAYRGLDPQSPLFLRADGEPYGLTARPTSSGALSYSCDALSQVIRRLHSQAGVEGGHAQAGRRTFAVRLHRKGFDIRHIAALLGHQTLTATRRLVDSDPVKLGDLVSRVI